jgi:penicillin amidase
MTPRRLASLLGLGFVSSLLAGCALITPLPRPTTLAERLAAFPTGGLPLEGRVTVYWNDRQVPFIEAETDADAAFTLGLVHAHLRLGQMEILRRIARGRIAEMGGPLATDIDHGLRILNFARAGDEIEKGLSDETRLWLESFVSGVNHYRGAAAERPHEYAVLGLDREPWTVGDALTIGRLAGSDVNWLVWGGIMGLRQRPDWPELWARLVANGSASLPSFEHADLAALHDIVAGLGRSGSNSMAIAPARTATGAAIMANDPHLGIMAPNTWLIAGVKSPSHHVVGLMGPGLPVFAIGRNPRIAWGGTNMRAAASELLDISGLGADEVSERRERIAVRWWFDREVSVRETRYGPVISDAPLFDGLDLPDFALRWTGHQASDEVGAMLAVARAQSFAEFRDAFATFAVPGQNMLYADAQGTIGQVMAVRLPARDGPPPADIILDPAEREPFWAELRGAGDLPFSVNPERGFLVSGNNRPADADIQIGYFFSPDDRVERMAELIESAAPLAVEDVMAIQRDVFMPSSVALRDLLVAKIDETGLAASPAERAALARIAGWDGHYRLDSLGAVAFERFRDAFTGSFYASAYGETDWQAFANVGRIKSLMIEDIEAAELEALRGPLGAGLERAAGFESFGGWGDMHRLRLAHPLANLPLIGGRYRFAEFPVAGSTDTIMKTAHRTTSERHTVRYGSNARHVSDMSDMDRNFFVLLGGQDGWFNSTTFLDQVPLWLAGEYIEMPLRIETVRATFPHRLELSR